MGESYAACSEPGSPGRAQKPARQPRRSRHFSSTLTPKQCAIFYEYNLFPLVVLTIYIVISKNKSGRIQCKYQGIFDFFIARTMLLCIYHNAIVFRLYLHEVITRLMSSSSSVVAVSFFLFNWNLVLLDRDVLLEFLSHQKKCRPLKSKSTYEHAVKLVKSFFIYTIFECALHC